MTPNDADFSLPRLSTENINPLPNSTNRISRMLKKRCHKASPHDDVPKIKRFRKRWVGQPLRTRPYPVGANGCPTRIDGRLFVWREFELDEAFREECQGCDRLESKQLKPVCYKCSCSCVFGWRGSARRSWTMHCLVSSSSQSNTLTLNEVKTWKEQKSLWMSLPFDIRMVFWYLFFERHFLLRLFFFWKNEK